jgi:hypothetical protein
MSPSAATKMARPLESGVESLASPGRVVSDGSFAGTSIHRSETLTSLVVTDVFPLPVEGETKVLADDEEVIII